MGRAIATENALGEITTTVYDEAGATGTPALAASNPVVVNGGTVAIISASESGTTVTVTTDGSNGFTSGDHVLVTGMSVAGYNGAFTVASASGHTFTYTDSSGLASATGGTASDPSATTALSGNQRSMVESITYTFGTAVTLGSGAFSIALHPDITVNSTPNQTAGTLPTLSWASPDGGTTWVVTFSGSGVSHGSIADGVYDITLNGMWVTSNSTGVTMVSTRTDTFFRLFGDSNGDAKVDSTDSTAYSGTSGVSNGSAGYLAYFDSNDDGTVDASGTDDTAFGTRSGTTWTAFTSGAFSTGIADSFSATVDALGNRTTTIYDAAGEAIATIDALGNRTTTAYDAAGNAVAVTDANNHTTTSVYDADNRQIATVDALGNRTTTTYDAAGNAVALTDANNHTTTTVYDGDNRQIATVDALGNRTTTVYDAAGNVVNSIDNLGNNTTYVYDGLNRQVETIDPLGRIATTVYDADDNVVNTIDGNDHTTTYVFDADNRQLSVTNGAGDITTTVYDIAGTPGAPTVSAVTVNGGTVAIVSASESGTTVTVTTNGNNGFNVSDSVFITGMSVAGYNGVFTIASASGNTFTYTAASGLGSATGGTATDAAAGYTALSGAQRSLVDSVVYTFNEPVDVGANAFSIALQPNVTVNAVTGQTVGTLPALSWSSPDGGTTWVVTFSGSGVSHGSIADGVYDITLNGMWVAAQSNGVTMLATRTDTFYRLFGDYDGNLAVDLSDASQYSSTSGLSNGAADYLAYFDYDDNGTVDASGTDYTAFSSRSGTTWTAFTSGASTSVVADSFTATIDPNGHITTMMMDGAGQNIASIDALGNITTTTYDAAGNAIAQTDANNHTTTSVYDADNRQVASVDALGNRTTTVYDAVGNVVNTIDANSNKTTYVYDADNRQVNTIDALTNKTTTVYDAVGNVVNQIDGAGDKTTFVYDADNRQTVQIDPLSNRTTTVYDLAGTPGAPTVSSVTVNGGTVALVSASESGTTVTVTTNGVDGFSASDSVFITGMSVAGYNGTFTIASVPTTDTFTYTDTSGLSSATGGTATDASSSGTALMGTQRSMVVGLEFNFSTPVTIEPGAFSIALHPNVTVNGTTGQTVGTLPTLSWASPDGGTHWVVTFSGSGVTNGSIANGVYDITLNGIWVVDGSGQTMRLTRTDTFYCLFGDYNADMKVDSTDYTQFLTSYNVKNGYPGYLAYFDIANDAKVSTLDLGFFNSDNPTTWTAFTSGATSSVIANSFVATIDPNSHITTTVMDAAGQTIASIDGLGNTTSMVYDNAGNLVNQIDPRGDKTTYVYDAANRQVNSIDGAGDKTTTVYDAAGNVVNSIDGRGEKTTYVYDADNRLVNTIDANSHKTTTVYDAA